MKEEQEQIQVAPERPVPLDDHFRILRDLEEPINNALSRATGQEGKLVGLRVSYREVPPDDADELNEAHNMGWGYLESLPDLERVREKQREWEEIAADWSEINRLTIQDVDDVYRRAKQELETVAKTELWTGWVCALEGSLRVFVGKRCDCGQGRTRYIYVNSQDQNVEECTAVGC